MDARKTRVYNHVDGGGRRGMGENPSVSCERLIAPAEEEEDAPPPLEDSDDEKVDGQEEE